MDALDRLFWHLVNGARTGSAALRATTIAEIYQTRAPYRLARAELGFSELAEYEHALLRLLAGERGYASLELTDVQEEFLRELRSPSPILGIYRDYAGVEVRLRSPGVSPSAVAPPAPVVVSATPSPTPEAAPVLEAEEESAPPCSRCGRLLPGDRRVNYCPLCGTAVRPVPCRSCGAGMEPAWGFCVECGGPRTAPAP